MDFRSQNTYDGLPLVTIGVLSFNYSQYVQDALNSLLSQTYPFIELIIIDDCSTEQITIEKINKWIADNNIKCTFIRNKFNLGITRVSNMIVQKAKGKYLNLFATDDIMLPEKIERQVKILEEAGEEYGMCYANVETMDEESNRTGLNVNDGYFPEGNIVKEFALRKMVLATPSSLIRKSVYFKVGLYDERILFEDYNFWLRLFTIYKAKFCSYPCLIYRKKKDSGVLAEWFANNRERYYHDRIISNLTVLPKSFDPELRMYLQRKNNQYFKSLAASNSNYFFKLFFYHLFKIHSDIPFKALIIKLLVQFNIKPGIKDIITK